MWRKILKLETGFFILSDLRHCSAVATEIESLIQKGLLWSFSSDLWKSGYSYTLYRICIVFTRFQFICHQSQCIRK